MMADDQALQGQLPHLANGGRGRSQLLPYQPHGFTVQPLTNLRLPCIRVALCGSSEVVNIEGSNPGEVPGKV